MNLLYKTVAIQFTIFVFDLGSSKRVKFHQKFSFDGASWIDDKQQRHYASV